MACEETRTVRSMRSIGLAAVVIGASTMASLAQSNGGSSQDLTRGLTDPKNGGVAGTGMGTTDKPSGKSDGTTSGAPGTGMSVKGPAGQGITGQTRDMNDSGKSSVTQPIGQ